MYHQRETRYATTVGLDAEPMNSDQNSAQLRTEFSDFLGSILERLGDIPASRWAKLAVALAWGMALSGGFKFVRRRRARKRF